MGRWTPLILMAGGVAILLGTLLGINFPMGGQQTANVPPGRKASSVLPANINVNSTATRDDAETATRKNNSATANGNGFSDADDPSRTSVAQNNTSTDPIGTVDNAQDTNNDNSTTETSSNSGNTNQDKEPIRALW